MSYDKTTKKSYDVSRETLKCYNVNVRNKKLKIKSSEKFHMHADHLTYSFLLIKKHQLKKYRKKKCKECSGNGVVGLSRDGVAVLCLRCVNTIPLFKEWYEYCSHFTDLKKRFPKLN